MNEIRDRYLTIQQAVGVLRSLNFDVSESQVERYANERRLPFFKFAKKLYISEQELIHSFRQLQLHAIRSKHVTRRSRL